VIVAAVVARADLGGFQVVEIPIPSEVPLGVPVPWFVESVSGTPILSSARGTLPAIDPASGKRPGSLLVTFAVPRRARAGVLPIANVRFEGAGRDPVEVPVHLMVASTQLVELTISEASRGVRPGDRFSLRYRLTNLGNAPESVNVQSVLPTGWRLEGTTESSTTLAVHAMVEQVLTIAVPHGSALGSQVVRLIATTNGTPVATAEARVTVQDDAPLATDGPVAALAVAFGWDPDGTVASGMTLNLNGRVTDDVSVTGAFTSTSDGGNSFALTSAGVYRSQPSLTLTAPTWEVTIGQTGTRLGNLTGVGLSGVGGSGSLTLGRFRASALWARSDLHSDQRPGVLAGGRIDVNAGAVILSGSASHLEQDRGEMRRLDALALGATLPGVMQGQFEAEVAQRWTSQGSHPGVSLDYARRTSTSSISLRGVHAPGGSNAFARATDELSAIVSRNVTRRLTIFGSHWHSQDDGSRTFGELTSRSTSAGARQQVGTGLSLGVTAQHSAFTSRGASFGFANGERSGRLDLSLMRGALRANLIGGVSSVTRDTRFPGERVASESGVRRGVAATVGLVDPRGSVELSGRYDAGSAGSGTLPRQVEVGLRVSDVPIVQLGRTRVLARASVRHHRTPGFGPDRTTLGVGTDVTLPFGVTIGATAERNPYLLDADGSQGGWLYGIRVGRSIGLPRLAHTATNGTVFEDRNGDGLRNAGEPGVPNVIVRHAGTERVTDAQGRYRFDGELSGALEVDPTSLPIGLLAVPSDGSAGQRDLAVTTVAPVEIHLTLAAEAVARNRSVDIGKVIVMARHSSGRMWVARKVDTGRAVFDALPPGTYQIVLDLLDVTEPLEVREDLPAFEVRGAAPVAPIAITLHTRKLSVKTLPSAGGGKP
jgi:hypothetical protein